MGCIVYDGPISDDLEDGIVGKGFPIEIYNVLGAGDAFMSGFLRGWLGGESLETSATWANAGGAFAVSRLLCSPEYPTFEELQFFLKNGSRERALRKDEAINHIHWATTRRHDIPSLMALAIDHRVQLEDIARKSGADAAKIHAFKVLAVKAAARVANGRPGYGMLIDEKFGREAMFEFARHSLFLARPAGRAAGLAAAALRVQPGYRLAADRMARRALHQVPVLLSPRRSGRAEGRAAGEAAHAVRGGPQGRPRAAGRDHRRQEREA